MKTLLAVMFLSALSLGQTTSAQDASELEAQYGTCAKHSIPADKCTAEIYQQLKAKDNAPLDANTAAALKAVKEYQVKLKNPESMQVQTAFITERGDICLMIGAQNGFGGIAVSRVVYTSRGRWLDEGGILGAMAADQSGSYTVDRWGGVCTKVATPFHPNPKQLPGTDVTEKVNQALKRVKEPVASTSQPTAHGTIGALSDDNPKVQHAASMPEPVAHDTTMAEPVASISQPTAHGTIGASCDGNPLVRHDGVTVSQVVTGGPAAQVGIEVGDVILAIDDHYVYTIEELNNAVDRCKPGSTIRIRYRRYSMTYEASLIVGNREAAKTEH
jgi:hypothetical protein